MLFALQIRGVISVRLLVHTGLHKSAQGNLANPKFQEIQQVFKKTTSLINTHKVN